MECPSGIWNRAIRFPLVDGQRLSMNDGFLEVIHTPGHTMGSICLKYGSFLFSGDHVLREISPNVGAGDLRRRDLLRHYLESLDRIGEYSEGVQVMPGHGDPFVQLGERCTQLTRHHNHRLRQLKRILRNGPLTVFEIAERLFGSLDNFHILLGCAEANSHLELLHELEEITFEQGKYRLL